MHNSGKEVHILIQHNFSRLVLQYNAYQVEGKHYSTTNSRYQSDTIHTKHSQRPYSHDHLLRISQHYMQPLSHYWIIPGVWATSFHLLFLPSKHCQDVLTTHEGTPLSDHANCHKQRSSYSLWLTHPRYHHQLINSCSVIITSSVSTSEDLLVSSDERIQTHINFFTNEPFASHLFDSP